MKSALKEKIAEILQVQYCDLQETEKYENKLEKAAKEYFVELGLSEQAKYHKALSDEKRLGIMKLLEVREMCVCELAAALGVTQPNLTHHIKKLESAGLVNGERLPAFATSIRAGGSRSCLLSSAIRPAVSMSRRNSQTMILTVKSPSTASTR